MLRNLPATVAIILSVVPAWVQGDDVSGTYLETRTCQVYTGPCFANAETALAGKEAVMAWNVEAGKHAGVDLTGLSVVMVISASDTLAFGGVDDPKSMRSAIIVDDRADAKSDLEHARRR